MECKAKAGARAPARGLGLLWETALLPSIPASFLPHSSEGRLPFLQMMSEKLPWHPAPTIPAPHSPGGLGIGAGEARAPAVLLGTSTGTYTTSPPGPALHRWAEQAPAEGPRGGIVEEMQASMRRKVLHVTAYFFSFNRTYFHVFHIPFENLFSRLH